MCQLLFSAYRNVLKYIFDDGLRKIDKNMKGVYKVGGFKMCTEKCALLHRKMCMDTFSSAGNKNQWLRNMRLKI